VTLGQGAADGGQGRGRGSPLSTWLSGRLSVAVSGPLSPVAWSLSFALEGER